MVRPSRPGMGLFSIDFLGHYPLISSTCRFFYIESGTRELFVRLLSNGNNASEITSRGRKRDKYKMLGCIGLTNFSIIGDFQHFVLLLPKEK